ncbi:MAG: dTDP-4-dehydrorhamnose 3,5-epimerase family protein [Acidimicrobiales bacterium]|nr:dTDP-4-dehydrorhamnose 3,5-epimerase family protein [Acidimicrobiales bacterium]
MHAEPTSIPGCVVVRLTPHADERGGLLKVFQASTALGFGFDRPVAECLVSSSHRGVVRGLHFQRPPHEHLKLVACIEGELVDVVLDLRRGSPTYGHHEAVHLRAAEPAAVLVPAGCAHGFQALTEPATLLYLISSEREPSAEGGVRWDSAGIAWPLPPAALSERDAELPPLEHLASPFSA